MFRNGSTVAGFRFPSGLDSCRLACRGWIGLDLERFATVPLILPPKVGQSATKQNRDVADVAVGIPIGTATGKAVGTR